MKKIEEQWKKIEDFPDYEISNFGRCRNKESRIILKRAIRKKGYAYFLGRRKGEMLIYCRRSAGMLVAKAFVENPNNYKVITYIDGNSENPLFTNIRWTDFNSLAPKKERFACVTKEEQLKRIREKIERAQRLEKALTEGKEQEFVYGEIKDLCREIVYKYHKCKFKNDMIDYITDKISEYIKRGHAILSFEHMIEKISVAFYKEYRKQLKTIEYDDKRRT
ncbi:MAG: hypothetical protein LBG15_09370 [Dysgonamonadaceae bacterium]|jgi:hypothetical protein|nr:hypothetical protein [Dysgonamonadaceae bacterium]